MMTATNAKPPIVEPFNALCTKSNGKLKVHDRDGMDQYIALFGDGEDLELTLEPASRRRTSKQNRFFHGPVVTAFMRMDLGYRTREEVKDMLCLLFIPRECRQMDGSVVVIPGHTHQLDVEAFNNLIEQCIQLAAENNQVVLDGQDWLAQQRQVERARTKGAA